MLSVEGREYASIIMSVVSSVFKLLVGDGVVVVVRPNRPPPSPLAPARGGFLVLWGLGQRVVLAPAASMAMKAMQRVVSATARRGGILTTGHNNLMEEFRQNG